MLLEHFGLSEPAFGVTPNHRFLYFTPGHQEALASLIYAVESDLGFSALIAEPGMGKTSLVYRLLERYRPSAETALVFHTPSEFVGLLRHVLLEFGVQPGTDPVELHEQLREVLLKSLGRKRRVLIVIDEAQNLADRVLESVRVLSNFETSRSKLLHILLAGQPGLAAKLARPELAQLRQRINVVAGLTPLSPHEVVNYIAHRLKVAGYTGKGFFTPEALQTIVAQSHGIPREINRLCFNSLSLAHALQKDVIDERVVNEVVADLDLRALMSPRPGAAAWPLTGAVLVEEFSRALGRSDQQHPWPFGNTGRTRVPYAERPGAEIAAMRWAGPLGEHAVPADLHAQDGQGPASAAVTAQPMAAAGAAAAAAQARYGSAGKKGAEVNGPTVHRPAMPLTAHNRRPPRRRIGRPWVAAGLAALVLGPLTALLLPRVYTPEPFPAAAQAATQAGESPLRPAQDQQSAPPPSPVSSEAVPPEESSAASAPSRLTRRHRIAPARSITNEDTTLRVSVRPIAPAPVASDSERKSLPEPILSTAGRESGDRNVHTLLPLTSLSLPPRVTFRPSDTVQPRLVKAVEPTYPIAARALRVEGEVVLRVTVGKDGKVAAVNAVAGHDLLRSAAVRAVEQWVYTPYLVNGDPQQVTTNIVIRFRAQQR